MSGGPGGSEIQALAFQSAPHPLLVLDERCDVVAANLATRELSSGFFLEEAIRCGQLLRCIHEKDNPRGCGYSEACRDCGVFQSALDTLRTGSPHFRELHRIERRRDEQLGPMHVLVTSVPLNEIEQSLVLVTLEDITRRIELEREKEELEERLRQGQKMESLGRLAGGVAHDLNNLLTPILGYSDLLLQAAEGDRSQRAELQEILQASRRARDLVHQLLALGQRQTLAVRNLDLNQVVKGFESLLRRTIREDIVLEFRFCPDRLVLRADQGQLEQVLMNLAVNGQDSMSQGGHLLIQTDRWQPSQESEARAVGLEPGRYVRLTVRDTGIGMDKATRERIFEPFFTTKEKLQRTGLGLATTYGIIQQHGGGIEVFSEPGQGTRFRLCFPEIQAEVEAPHAEQPIRADLTGQEQILLVEDDPGVAILASRILEKKGYRVLMAADGIQGLHLLESHSEPIHLLLTDVVLPGMDGREVFRRARELRPSLRVLYMSGYPEDVISDNGTLKEGFPFLQKPFSIQALAAKVREALSSPPESEPV